MSEIAISLFKLPNSAQELRKEVRDFLNTHLAKFTPVQRARNWAAADSQFSRSLGERGWIGMTWPRKFGGAERSMLERYVVIEELLAAGAPVAAHWVADRQSGPLLLKYAADTLAPKILPGIAKGTVYFCIGMSEPDTGSDLASIRTRAIKSSDGASWVINGSKVWTSRAHESHYMIALVRTSPRTESRHEGLSQFLIDMRSRGVTVRPIRNLLGEAEFNEVIFDNLEVPAENLIGQEGQGWSQVTEELAHERSGPERYMSSTQVVIEMIRCSKEAGISSSEIGSIVARFAAIRQMSLGVAGLLSIGKSPSLAAAIVKDQGALLEQLLPEEASKAPHWNAQGAETLREVTDFTALVSPSFSLRGGTREILRSIIAREVGLR